MDASSEFRKPVDPLSRVRNALVSPAESLRGCPRFDTKRHSFRCPLVMRTLGVVDTVVVSFLLSKEKSSAVWLVEHTELLGC